MTNGHPSQPQPSELVLLARLGAHSRWAKESDRTAATAPARAALEASFLAEAEGDPVRALSVRKAYYARLSLASARARRERSAKGAIK